MNHFRPDILRNWLGLALWLLGSLSWQPAQAAPPTQTEPPPEAIVYAVQEGDTLVQIAQRFGVSVDVLAAANGIDDPAYITVGQRLIIPPPSEAPEPGLQHTVRPGETLHALSLRYRLSPHELARTNHLLRPDRLFVSELLSIDGPADEPPPLTGRTHTIRAGETIAAIAVQHHVSPWALAAGNELEPPFVAWPDTRLWVPAEEGEFLDWPAPFAGFQMHPIPAVQGHTLSVVISLTMPVSLTGSLLDTPLSFFPSGDTASALAGVDMLSQDGTHTLVVTASLGSNGLARYAQRIPVVSGEYGEEHVTAAEEVVAQLTPEIVQSEAEFLEGVFALQTDTRMWDGYFLLPAPGDITSPFGTGRTYNVPSTNPYHTGTDFATRVGTPVHSPADGIVVFSEPLTVRGNAIIIDHGWGVMTGYWHLSTSVVSAGERIVAGQHLGNTGNTGLSTGPHLHWELRVGGVPVDGLQWIREQFP